jgi:3-hydroxyisobutyrate dehydrogenase
MPDQVALIGVGAMGQALLARLRAAGKKVRAYDVAPGAQQAARDGGATVTASAADATRGAAFVHVIVASDAQTIDAMLGEEGVLAEAGPGTLVFLHGTILPDTTRRIADTAAKNNVDVIDTPIAAVPARLEAGHAAFLVGGAPELVDKARGYLLQLGEAVHHFGPLGAGNVVKLARALLNAGERVLLSEVLAILTAGGIDPRRFLEIEGAENRPSNLACWEKNFEIANGEARHRPATNLFNKDVMLAAELAQLYGLDTPMSQGAADTAKRWVEEWKKAAK